MDQKNQTGLLDALVEAGARLAEPGEFTKRAFLNGKMDLSRAEAVAELIESDNERAREAAIRQLAGKEEILIRRKQEEILEIMAITIRKDFKDLPRANRGNTRESGTISKIPRSGEK